MNQKLKLSLILCLCINCVTILLFVVSILWGLSEQLNAQQAQLDEITGGVGAILETLNFRG